MTKVHGSSHQYFKQTDHLTAQKAPDEIKDDKDPKIHSELAWLRRGLAGNEEFRDIVVAAMKQGKYKVKIGKPKGEEGRLVQMVFRDAKGKKHVVKVCKREELAKINDSAAMIPLMQDAASRAARELGVTISVNPPPKPPDGPTGPNPRDPVDPNDPLTYGPRLGELAASYPELAAKISALTYGQLFLLVKAFYASDTPSPTGDDSAVDAIIKEYNRTFKELSESARWDFEALVEFAYEERMEQVAPLGPVIPGNPDTYGVELRLLATYYPSLAGEVAALNYGQLFLLEKVLYEDKPKPTGEDAAVDQIVTHYNKINKGLSADESEDLDDMVFEASYERQRQLEPHGPVVPNDPDTYGVSLRSLASDYPALAAQVAGLDYSALFVLSRILTDEDQLLPLTGTNAAADQFIAEYNKVFNTTIDEDRFFLNLSAKGAVLERLRQLSPPPAQKN